MFFSRLFCCCFFFPPSFSFPFLSSLQVGKRVAIIGAGGIGFDVAEFLLHRGKEGGQHDDDDDNEKKKTKKKNDDDDDDDADTKAPPPSLDLEKFLKQWGIDHANALRGGLLPTEEHESPFRFVVFILSSFFIFFCDNLAFEFFLI